MVRGRRLFETRQEGFDQLLPYAQMVGDGVLALKHGAFLTAWTYRGPDMETASYDDLAALSQRVNGILNRLGAGWAVWADVVRSSVAGYTPQSPENPLFKLLDEERRVMFSALGTTYQSTYVLALVFTPPLLLQRRIENWFFERDDRQSLSSVGQRLALAELTLQKFQQVCQEVEASLGRLHKVSRMSDYRDSQGAIYSELLQYLRFCVHGVNAPVRLPCVPVDIDGLLSADFIGGMQPRIDGRHIRCIAIDGFPMESYPGILAELDRLALEYRWSNRILLLDPNEAKARFGKIRRHWQQVKRPIQDALYRTSSGSVNLDAAQMDDDANEAISHAAGRRVRYACFSSVVVVLAHSEQTAQDHAQLIKGTLDDIGFPARIEDTNAIEAYLGTLPGHVRPNVRRPIPHTLNIADFIPFSSAWAGEEVHPCPYYPPQSPPLFQAVASGETVFKCSLHVNDVGHFGVIGPTGAGKSTLLGLLVASHFRYPGARVIVFDYKRSMLPLAMAAGGQHYDLGSDDLTRAFCPLQSIDTPADQAWAVDYLTLLMSLQEITVTPSMRNEIAHTVRAMAVGQHRSLTAFRTLVQDSAVTESMGYYTDTGPLAATLDGEAEHAVGLGDLTVFETQALMERGPMAVNAVLSYLFRAVQKTLDGRPTLLILDEAGLALNNEHWQKRINEWLRTLRDANVAFGFATQDVGSIANNQLLQIIIESCQTMFLLPNPRLANPTIREMYGKHLGLTPRQMDILKDGEPRQDYFYLSPEGRRMIDLRLGPAALAFIGATGKENIQKVRDYQQQYGDRWPVEWLTERGEEDLAQRLETLSNETTNVAAHSRSFSTAA